MIYTDAVELRQTNTIPLPVKHHFGFLFSTSISGLKVKALTQAVEELHTQLGRIETHIPHFLRECPNHQDVALD